MAGSNLFLILLLIAVSFVLIIFGGDFFINSAVWIAKKTKIPQLIIGATVVSIGTTLPEILVSITAAAKGDPGIAIGNAAGSMLCNLAFIMGLSILLKPAKNLGKKGYLPKFAMMLALSALLFEFITDDRTIALPESILLLAVFVTFIAMQVLDAVKEMRLEKATLLTAQNTPLSSHVRVEPPAGQSAENAAKTGSVTVEAVAKLNWQQKLERYPAAMILLFIAGAGMIGVGANLMVDNVAALCVDYLKIPTMVVGYTVVAFGTSLPEFVTAIKSVRKNTSAISYGNIIGANFINGSLILGACGAIGGLDGLAVGGAFDLFALLLALGIVTVFTAVLAFTVLLKGKTYRVQGAAMMISYIAYCTLMVVQQYVPFIK